jgi:HAD superfamily hydrolase (TIGR01549 family)
VGWERPQHRAGFELYGLQIREWDSLRTDWLTLRPVNGEWSHAASVNSQQPDPLRRISPSRPAERQDHKARRRNAAVCRDENRAGMSGGLLVNALLREIGRRLTKAEAARLLRLHHESYLRQASQVRVLPGASELLACLSRADVRWAIATSGRLDSAQPMLELVRLDPQVPVVTRDEAQPAKPDPDLFLAAAKHLGVPLSESIVVGDGVWDLLAARRARALGVGLLSGGYGQDELERAGAYRVYQDPADILRHIDEVGVRIED